MFKINNEYHFAKKMIKKTYKKDIEKNVRYLKALFLNNVTFIFFSFFIFYFIQFLTNQVDASKYTKRQEKQKKKAIHNNSKNTYRLIYDTAYKNIKENDIYKDCRDTSKYNG